VFLVATLPQAAMEEVADQAVMVERAAMAAMAHEAEMAAVVEVVGPAAELSKSRPTAASQPMAPSKLKVETVSPAKPAPRLHLAQLESLETRGTMAARAPMAARETTLGAVGARVAPRTVETERPDRLAREIYLSTPREAAEAVAALGVVAARVDEAAMAAMAALAATVVAAVAAREGP
jgi:hypothetical protein